MGIALASVFVLTALRHAPADQCPLAQPLIATYEIPAGCPLVVYVAVDAPPYVPDIGDTRADALVPIETTVHETTETLDATTVSVDPTTCVHTTSTAPRAFRVYTIDVAGAESGDWLEVDGGSVPVLDAGPCWQTPLPTFGCQPDETCETAAESQQACSAGGGSGGLAVVALALVVGARRRRHARAA